LAGSATSGGARAHSRGRGCASASCFGVGYKHEHFDDIRQTHPQIGFFEIHAENFMGNGGEPHARLEWLRRDYQISIHGVGLSIGGDEAVDALHLARVKRLVDRYEPTAFSEHLAWSRLDGCFYNDLLPIPYTRETLSRVADNVERVQDALGRRILIENPATYLQFPESTLHETAFLTELAQRTGCGLLLDIANAFVCAANHAFQAEDYLEQFPLSAVEEIHLAGFHVDEGPDEEPLVIDSHSAPVAEEVWRLYETAIARIGPIPSMIEWDNRLPPWSTLFDEARRAEALVSRRAAARPGNRIEGARHAAGG
jgi:uncharacterized protein (UPF0276 family)